jgi:hypothetical protein
MPGVPDPVGIGPGGIPPFWNAVLGAIKGQQQATNGLAGGAPAGWVPDQWGNVTELSGANLNQVVTIGAGHLQAGVLVSTGIPSGTAGHAVFSGPAITTITLTQGSISATVGTVTGAALAQGQVIGAALATDPTTGTPTSAITPGTTIASVSGSSVTLSQGAAESGTSLYCAAGQYILQQDTGWVPITIPSGFTGSVQGRLQNGTVRLKGSTVDVSAGSPTLLLTVPSFLIPSATRAVVLNVNGNAEAGVVNAPAGTLVTGAGTTTGWTSYFDSVTYPL